MVRTEIRYAAVLQGVWLPTSPQTAMGQVKAMREIQPNAEVQMVPSTAPEIGKTVDVRA